MRRGALVFGVGLAMAVPAVAGAQQAVTLPARDTPLRDRTTTLWEVGTDEGRDWEMFAGIRAVAFDRQDNVYVLDQQNTRVVVFDASGKYVRQFGRKGQGPGELSLPLQLTVTADGQVVVGDLGNRAFIVFDRNGEHLRNVPFGEEMGMLAMGGVHADPRGGVVARSNAMIRPDDLDQPNITSIFRQPLAEGAQAQPIYRLSLPKPHVMEGPSSREGGRAVRVMSMDPIFGARTTFGVLPDGGIAVSHETPYNIRILDASGRHVRSLSRSYPLRRVTKKDQEAWEERRQNAMANGTGPTTIVAASTGGGATTFSTGGGGRAPGGAARAAVMSIEDMQWAQVMSIVTGVRTDPSGRIWVQRRADDGSDAGPIDLVMSDGRYIGTLPAQPLPDAVSASGLAAWIVRDDLGIERVSVRRIPPGWR